MINRYIKELLNEHNRVIVPDLGAFLYKGESSKTIYFNEFLRFNDGLLLNYIAEQGKIDKIEAAKQIKAYVEGTNKLLQAKKKVAIEGIGYLYLDENDKIQLQSDANTELQTEEPQSKPSIAAEEPKVSEKTEPVVSFEKPANEVNSGIKPLVSFDFPETKRNTVAQETIKESPKPTFQTPPPTKAKNSASAAGKKKSTPTATKNNRLIIWIASIVVIIIITLLYLFIIKPLYQNKEKEKNAVITNANLDTIVIAKKDSTQETMQPVTKQNNTVPMTNSGHKKYHLVVGCFVQENNADKVVQKLRNDGFSPEKFAKIEQMYFVSIASFNNKASAEKHLHELKSKGYKDIWIKYH